FCALSGDPFGPKVKPEFDHITPLWLGGENRESNLQAIKGEAHKRKTKTEAAVRAKVYAAKDRHLGLKSKKKAWPRRPKADRPKRDVLDRPGPELNPLWRGRPGDLHPPIGGTDHD